MRDVAKGDVGPVAPVTGIKDGVGKAGAEERREAAKLSGDLARPVSGCTASAETLGGVAGGQSDGCHGAKIQCRIFFDEIELPENISQAGVAGCRAGGGGAVDKQDGYADIRREMPVENVAGGRGPIENAAAGVRTAVEGGIERRAGGLLGACSGRRAGWSLCKGLFACSQQSQSDKTVTKSAFQALFLSLRFAVHGPAMTGLGQPHN